MPYLKINAKLGVNNIPVNECVSYVRGRLIKQIGKYRAEQWYKLWFGLIIVIFKLNNERNIKNVERSKFEINLVNGCVCCEYYFEYKTNGEIDETFQEGKEEDVRRHIVGFNREDIRKYLECDMDDSDDNWNQYFMAVIEDYGHLHMTLSNTHVELV